MSRILTIPAKDRVVAFAWQHLLLLISLFFMAIGVSLCVRSDLGSSVISSAPWAFTLAGGVGKVPGLTLGTYTNILNGLLVVGQIVVLGRRFQPVQLLQLVIGIVFGTMIDLSMILTADVDVSTLTNQCIAQFAGCTIMAFGISLEMRCASITMPGEGLPAALSKRTGRPFADMKICVDIVLVVAAIISGYLFFGRWMWNVVGVGTLFAMIYVGAMVKLISKHLKWFDAIIGYRPGFRRYLFGLARFVNRHQD